MPALVRQGPFSYDSNGYSATKTYNLVKAAFVADKGDILEVLINGVKIVGEGANAAGDEFTVNSLTNPTSITVATTFTTNDPATSSALVFTSGTILVKRLSNRSTPVVDFAPGSVIREQDLDNSTNQTLHVAQEAMDIAISGMVLAANDKFDGKSKVIENVSNGIANNDAVNKAQLTATEVTTLAYKEDTEDYKLEAGDWATKVNGVVNTYTDNVAQDDGSDQSAKAYAIGGTGVTTTASKGAAKEWATTTSGAVDTSDFSSKAWAIGGTGVTTTSGKGAAKEWASGSGLIDTASYSSKEYASSATAGTSTYGGSAKGWSQTAVDTAVPGAGSSDRSALHYSTAASNSATSAKASAAAVASVFDSFDDTYLGKMADGATATDADTTGTWAINSNVITVASATNIVVGQEVTGAGIPTDANVIVVAGTSITISENMTAAGSGVDLDFRGQGVYGAFNVTKDGPATDNDGGALANGMLYFNTTDNSMKVYKETGASWIKTSASGGVSLVMHKYVYASGTATSALAAQFTPTLTYEVNNIVVWLNGVKLDATDYVATNGNDITSLAALAVNDELVVLAFKTFEVGDAVSAASGGTFGGAVTFSAVPVFSAGVGTISGSLTGNASGTAATVTTAAQPAITSVGTLTAVTVTGAITANGGLETDTNSKVIQKGAFMQSSTHQSLVLGG